LSLSTAVSVLWAQEGSLIGWKRINLVSGWGAELHFFLYTIVGDKIKSRPFGTPLLKMADKVFINYRRDDSSATAGRLHDRLARQFGQKNLFMDVDNMPAGIDFVTYLNTRVEACDLFLAVIGPDWLDAKSPTGSRRLDDPEDYVAVEIAAALRRDIPVIPVLIDGARVPQSDELPEPLKPLVRRHAVEVRNAQFRRDADALAEKVHEVLRIKRPRRSVHVGLAALLLGLAGLGFILFQTGLPGWLVRIPGAPGPNARGVETAAMEPAAPSSPPASSAVETKASSNPPNAPTQPATLREGLLERMAAYSIPTAERPAIAEEFEAAPIHKAIAVSPEAQKTWPSSRWPSASEAETGALERCQVRYGKPCVLIGRDDKIAQANDGPGAVRDMPRVRHAGMFDIHQIPGVSAEVLARADVISYAAASEPKAAALHPQGMFSTVTDAPGQFEAEEQALAKCRAAAPKYSGDPCLLYAVGNQVVLPQRSDKPLSPRFHDALVARMTAYAVPAAERWATEFEAQRGHKAFAVSPQTHDTFWSGNWPSALEAGTGALEGCQIRYSNPCALMATDDKITPENERRMRDMPRSRYAGTFDPQQIPQARLELLIRSDVANYASAPPPKAAAFHTEGIPTFIVVTGAASQFDAEDQALSKCNAVPKQSDGPCFLYAFGNQVVLPLRSTKPLTQRETAAVRPVAAVPQAKPDQADDNKPATRSGEGRRHRSRSLAAGEDSSNRSHHARRSQSSASGRTHRGRGQCISGSFAGYAGHVCF
jgi:hypothetical protein